MDLPVFVSVFSKFFFILTPFFVIAVFLTITDEENTERRIITSSAKPEKK